MCSRILVELNAGILSWFGFDLVSLHSFSCIRARASSCGGMLRIFSGSTDEISMRFYVTLDELRVLPSEFEIRNDAVRNRLRVKKVFKLEEVNIFHPSCA